MSGLFVRANVKIINSTNKSASPIVFGPILDKVRHIYPPFLHPTHVEVTVSKATRIYVGFVVPNLKAAKSTRLLFRLKRPLPGHSILATQSTHMRASSWSILDNPNCHIPG